MILLQIIQNHYNAEQAKAMIHLLQSQRLYDPVEDISRKFYSRSKTAKAEQIRAHFYRHAQMFVELMSGFLQKLPDGNDHKKIVTEVLSFSVILMADALDYYSLEPLEIYDGLEEMILNDDFLEKHHHRMFCEFFGKVMKSSWKDRYQLPNSSGTKKECPQPYLVFNHFDEDDTQYMKKSVFIGDLSLAFPDLQKQNNIIKLFSPDAGNYFIIITEDDLPPFLAVFHHLHRCGRFSLKNSRGLFKHLQSHLKAPKGKSLPDWKDYSQYYNFMMNDENFRKKVFKRIGELLQKYTPKKQ